MVVIEFDGVVVSNVLIRFEDLWSQVEGRGEAAGTQAAIAWLRHPDPPAQRRCRTLPTDFGREAVARLLPDRTQ